MHNTYINPPTLPTSPHPTLPLSPMLRVMTGVYKRGHPAHSHTYTHTHTHPHAHTHAHSHALTLTLTRTLTRARTHTHTGKWEDLMPTWKSKGHGRGLVAWGQSRNKKTKQIITKRGALPNVQRKAVTDACTDYMQRLRMMTVTQILPTPISHSSIVID